MNTFLYDNVLRVTPDVWRESGLVNRYFEERSRRFWDFSYTTIGFRSDADVEVMLARYESGAVVDRKTWRCPRWLPNGLKYAFVYACYLNVAVTMPRRTWTVVHSPVFCVAHSLLRICKGQRTFYWVWDHFGDQYSAYAKLDDFYVRRCPHVLFLTPPMAAAFASRAPAPRTAVRGILPLGTHAINGVRAPQDGRLGYIGNIRGDDGLTTVIDALALDLGLRLDVVGSGNADQDLVERARKAGVEGRVHFFGQVFDAATLASIVSSWQIGLAPYIPSKYSPYGDSGKIKTYWQYGLPVVTTKTMCIYEEVIKEHAGEVAESDPQSLVAAVGTIRGAYASYLPGVERLRGKYEYGPLYDAGLAFMRTGSRE